MKAHVKQITEETAITSINRKENNSFLHKKFVSIKEYVIIGQKKKVIEMTAKKYIVWDWNGTLLNDIDLCVTAINQLLKQEDLPIFADKEAYQRIFRFPIQEYYKDAGFDFEKRSFRELAENYMAYYQPKSLNCKLHEHVPTILNLCKEQGLKQILLSASKKENLLQQVHQYDIIDYFDDVLGLDNTHAFSKAELAKDWAKDIPNPEEILFFGDSVHDYEVAKGTGADCILIANGHEHKEKLHNTGCMVINTIDEVKQILSSIR